MGEILTQAPLRVLIVEDHPEIAADIGDYLSAQGHVPDYASDGIIGLHLALTSAYDVIVLDVVMPRMDGLEVCRRLRNASINTPVLMLTSLDAVSDTLEGFWAGTDDYMTKPYSLQELEVRLLALVRRAKPQPSNQILRVKDLKLDLGTLVAHRAGRRIDLNPAALKTLRELMQASPNVVTKARLEVALWGDAPLGGDALRAHICSLRRAIDKPFDHPLLHTVHGIGYRLYDPEAETQVSQLARRCGCDSSAVQRSSVNGD